jgi:hypothetical protein
MYYQLILVVIMFACMLMFTIWKAPVLAAGLLGVAVIVLISKLLAYKKDHQE